MTIDLSILGRRTEPDRTILLFGAGSSIPSGAPSSAKLVTFLAQEFCVKMQHVLRLSDLATIIEHQHSRREMVEAIHTLLAPLRPIRGILNLPDFDWAGLYTTNYDQLIEKSFQKRGKPLEVIASNFDFGSRMNTLAQKLYKLHGTIECDVSLGHQHRLIISASDYDITNDFRECLYTKFAEQIHANSAIIIGSSLSDPDLRETVEHAVRAKRQRGAPGKITLLVFEADENQALIYETRGLDVCIGGIDDFFAEMVKKVAPAPLIYGLITEPLDRSPDVHPSTIPVASARANETGNLARMFNGSAANYADIMRGWTFERDFADRLEAQLAADGGNRIACVLGPAGSGKTTGVRKALLRINDRGISCWEHIREFTLPTHSWVLIDDELRKRKQTGVLLIDDAHENLNNANTLIESVCKHEKPALKIVLVSSKPNWNPRLKTPAIFSHGEIYELKSLSEQEINSLLDILDITPDIAALVERSFSGFSRAQRQRRLAERCQSDMFVCMKNIFASESFDEILLREYAELLPDYQEVYKQIAGMEAAGVRVHRQLVLRSVGVPASQVRRYLDDLDGIIKEETINEREGIFAWRVRHGVIANIIAKYKFSTESEVFSLLSHTIDHLSPSYAIEVASMNDICDPQQGLAKIYDKNKQNYLLRKMISLAPRERVPRHRLITNLIAVLEFEQASREIRLFEQELRVDGPVHRYKVKLLVERAKHANGLLNEDRAAMVREAASLAERGVERFPDDKNMYRAYLEAGVAYFRYDPDRTIFDRAMSLAKSAYERILDPDLQRTIRRFEQIEQRFSV